MKIIIVDDELAALNTFLMHIVDDPDIEYKMFRSDPMASIRYVQSEKVDMAFLDINMPQINGIELAEKMTEACPGIKIVFISGEKQEDANIPESLLGHLYGYCHKPYDTDLLYRYIRARQAELGDSRVFIKTFGSFDLFVGGKAVRFSSAKSKELLALLVDRRGAHVTMSETLTMLWPDRNIDYSKRLYRDAVCRLRMTLKENGLQHLVSFYRAELVINCGAAECDLWRYLDSADRSSFTGEYLPSYDWSMETQTQLETTYAAGRGEE